MDVRLVAGMGDGGRAFFFNSSWTRSGGRRLSKEASLSHHRQLDTVRREESNKGGAHYITQRRRSPRRSPSGGLLSPLISGNEVSVLKPLSRSPSRQGCHGVQKVVQRGRGRERGLQENTDSDGETSAQHSTP
ncbi:hypothetical protein HHUSO_G34654 [Huso huso]|uniref:Uncharacterized protein n=1 Tax=Huso huso TaxID=61971 RepID=A0ABR0Y5C1_HUSHU